MCSGSWPNFSGWLDNTWGAGQELQSAGPFGLGVVGLSFGTNPPYYLDDFLAICPKFFGPSTQVFGVTTTIGSNVVAVLSAVGMSKGQFLQSAQFPPGTTILSVDSATQATLSSAALASATAAALSVYEQPPIPAFVVQMYLNLALASLVQDRWQDQWAIAIAWYTAHYCTLWARSDAEEIVAAVQAITHGEVPQGTGTAFTLTAAPPGGVLQALSRNGVFQTPGGVDYTLSGNAITLTVPLGLTDALYATWTVPLTTTSTVSPNAAQIAAQGLAFGIQTSKSVGDVSVSYQALAKLEDWGTWNLTSYGQMLATAARVIGMGPLLVW